MYSYVIYLEVSKTFYIVSCEIVLEKLIQTELDKNTVVWAENWLEDRKR